MKVFFALLASSLLLACGGSMPINPPGGGGTTNCVNCPATPASRIQYATGAAMVQQYKGRQHAKIVNNNNLPFPHSDDARAIWFSLDELKAMICDMERTMRPEGYNGHQMGIRFYYAAYPNNMASDPGFSGLPANYNNRHTLILVPSVLHNGRPYDVNILDRDSYPKGNYEAFLKKANNTVNYEIVAIAGEMSTAQATSGDPTIQNHGTLYPPGTGSNFLMFPN